MHAKDDKGVPLCKQYYFCNQLKKHKVPVEIYLYDGGGHGFGMNNPTSNVKWMDLVEEMDAHKISHRFKPLYDPA